jgi:hypothetical protein
MCNLNSITTAWTNRKVQKAAAALLLAAFPQEVQIILEDGLRFLEES